MVMNETMDLLFTAIKDENELLKLKREIVVHMYNTQANTQLPQTQQQFEERISVLFNICDRYISDEYYNLSPSLYQQKHGDEGPTMAWMVATKIVHTRILERSKKVWPPIQKE